MEESRVIDNLTKMYNRSNSTNLIELTDKISSFYSNNYTLITSSGMHAITTTLISIAIQNKWKSFNLVYSDELYCDTPRFIYDFSSTYSNILTWPINVENSERIIQIFSEDLKDKFNVLFIESCSNPNSNFSIIPTLRRSSEKLIVIVDNTWLSHVIFNPFNQDVDVTVTSLTKYYSAGTRIMGACIFKDKTLYDIAFKKNKYEGVHICPENALHVSLVTDNITERIIISSAKTVNIINLLESNKKYQYINHPCLQTNSLSSQYFENGLYPSVFTITVNCKLNKLKKILSKKILPLITSFGSAFTKVDPWPYEKSGLTTFRISVGYADEDIIEISNKINSILDKM